MQNTWLVRERGTNSGRKSNVLRSGGSIKVISTAHHTRIERSASDRWTQLTRWTLVHLCHLYLLILPVSRCNCYYFVALASLLFAPLVPWMNVLLMHLLIMKECCSEILLDSLTLTLSHSKSGGFIGTHKHQETESESTYLQTNS